MILPRKRELIALLQYHYCCYVADSVVCLFVMVPCVGLLYIIVLFPGNNYLLHDFVLAIKCSFAYYLQFYLNI